MDLNLKNKKVFISGSTKGIGFETAKLFLKEGASVIINGTWSDSIFDITTNSIVIKNMTIESSANGTTKECIEVSSGSGIVIKNLILKNCYNGISL